MADPTYAVIAYLPGKLGEFVDGLRQRLNSAYASWLAHVTLLPPRPLPGSPEEILARLREGCAHQEPFDVVIGGVATFWPVNGVVYLSFSIGFEKLVEVHHRLHTGPLACQEAYEYTPHVTIAQGLDELETHLVLAEVYGQWLRFEGKASFRLESLFLVQQTSQNTWRNLAPIPLSSFFYAARR
jgi:2'-5' RNA ligase